jgi:hypothetical protein
VRPTDENQAASTRPNLMSSRRGAGEDNILAMLERDSARRPGGRMSGVRLASYGAAAALAGILAGGVAWLAYDNHKSAQDMQARHDAAPGAAPTVLADASLPPLPPPSPGPSPIVEAPRSAVIVDESVRRPDAPAAPATPAAASSVPPLVMLPPSEAAGAKPTLPAPRLVQEVAQPAPAKPEPLPVAPRIAAEKKAEPVAPRVAAAKKAEKAVEKKTEKAPKLASRAAKAATARAGVPAKGRVEAAVRTRNASIKSGVKSSAKPADAAVDSDVALISAIISHDERHRGEREAAGSCSAKCPPAKPARR